MCIAKSLKPRLVLVVICSGSIAWIVYKVPVLVTWVRIPARAFSAWRISCFFRGLTSPISEGQLSQKLEELSRQHGLIQ